MAQGQNSGLDFSEKNVITVTAVAMCMFVFKEEVTDCLQVAK